MGRYIDDILQPGEKVLYSTNAHWIFYLPAMRPGSWPSSSSCCHGRPPPKHRPAVPGGLGRGGDRGALLDPEGLVPSLDHRDRRHHMRVVHKTGFIKRRTFEMSLDKVESVDVNQSILGRILNYGDVTVRASARVRDHRYHRFATRIPQSHHRAIGAARNPWPCKKILAAISPPPPRPRSTPARSRNSQNCRTNGGSQRQMAPLHKINPLRLTYIRDAACRKFERNVKKPELPFRPADPLISAAAQGCVRAVDPPRRAGDRHRSFRQQYRSRPAARRQGAPVDRLSLHQRRADGCARTLRHRAGDGGDRARHRRRHVPQSLRSDAEARRADGGLDHKPHLEELRAGDRRRGIHPALAAARHPSMGQVRHPRRTRQHLANNKFAITDRPA